MSDVRGRHVEDETGTEGGGFSMGRRTAEKRCFLKWFTEMRSTMTIRKILLDI